MQNMQLFDDVAPLISRFPPRLRPLDAEVCATRGHFGSNAQPVGRAVLALHGGLLLGFLLGFLPRTAMPKRSKKLSPHRRIKPALSWKPVGALSSDHSPEETPTCRLLDKKLDLWLRGWMKAVAGRAFVLVQWFRIALPRAFWQASRSMDSERNQRHWAARTTPDGSRWGASSSSRWWRYHGHPSVPWRPPRGSQGSWLHVEVSRETAHSELLLRTWQRKLLALTWRAIFCCTAFLCWRWLRGVFQRASRALSFRSKMVRFD